MASIDCLIGGVNMDSRVDFQCTCREYLNAYFFESSSDLHDKVLCKCGMVYLVQKPISIEDLQG